MKSDHCLNCGNLLLENYKFCPSCGQTAHVHKINGSHLAHELVHFFTHADKGIFFLIKQLATRPGHVAREYIEGKRKKYFNPISFFFIVAGLFVFALTTFHTFERYRSMAEAKKATMQIPDPVVRERRLAKLDRVEKAQKFVSRYANFVSMVATPLAALILFLCFIKYRFNYTEHLMVNLCFAGFDHLLFIFIFAPIMNSSEATWVYLTGLFGYLAFETIYRSIGYYQFINKKGFVPFLHALGSSILVTVFWSFFSRSMITWYINEGFWGILK